MGGAVDWFRYKSRVFPVAPSNRFGVSLALWQRVVLFGLGYLFFAWLGTFFSPRGGAMVSFWLPAGLYISVLLLNPQRNWLWLSVGALVANLIFDTFFGTPLLPTLGFFLANSVEAVTAAWIIQKFISPRLTLGTLREITALMVISGVGSSMLGAAIGAGTMVWFGMSTDFQAAWTVWWGSNALAILLLAPFILTWFARVEVRVNYLKGWPKKVELLALLLALKAFLFGLLVWGDGIMSSERSFAVPLLLWAGLRFGPRIATAASLYLALPIAYFTTQHFVGLSTEQIVTGSYIFGLQQFLAMANLVALVPAVVLDERNRAVQQLRDSERSLRATLEITPDVAVQWITRDGVVNYWNRASENIYGWRAEEARGRKLSELFFREEQWDTFQKVILKIEQTGRPVGPVEFPLWRRDGRRLTVLSTVFEIPAPGGGSQFVCMDVDLTERKFEENLNRTQLRILEMISAGKPPTETLDALLREIEAQVPEMHTSILLLTPDGLRLRHGAAPSLPAEYTRAVDGVEIGPCVGSCGTAAFRREPVYVTNIATDPLWASFKELILPHGFQACWSTPILDPQQNVMGTFAIYYRQSQLPEEKHRRLISVATHTAAISLLKERAEKLKDESIVREQSARAQYTLQLIAAQETERRRLAAELHDSLGQNLLLIKNFTQLALAEAATPDAARESLLNVSQLIGQSIAEVRQISRDLHPHHIEHFGLKRALEILLENTAHATPTTQFTWHLDELGSQFQVEAATNLYRIVQESLNNTLKHARARTVRVELECDLRELTLRIIDDGCGFNPAEAMSHARRLGLKNLAERARMLAGNLALDSAPGQGARITLVVPIPETET